MSFIELSGDTVNRAFRLDKALDDELEREAEKTGTNVSALLLQMVNSYLNFHRYNLYRNYINMGSNTLIALLKNIDERQLYPCGYEMGTENPISRVIRAGMRPDVDSLFIYLQTLDTYADWFRCEEKTIDEVEYIYISHNHGPLWTKFLEGYLNGIFDKLELRAEISMHGDSFLINVR